MCTTCGCNQPHDAVKIFAPGENLNLKPMSDQAPESGVAHHHGHSHAHGHDHHHHGESREIQLEQDILRENQLLAERNRGFFQAREILALNLVSSPGSGKTALLERTVADLKGKMPLAIIEGDQQTSNDADRIAATGAPVVQINTGKGCHLDAHMVLHAIQKLKPAEGATLFIENVGNLVCPAMFDLGENKRVVIISITEGEDKPIKYPDMFASADICLINKIDLLPYIPFDLQKTKEYALRVNHRLEFLEVSALTGEGMDAWYAWLENQRKGIPSLV